jgi:hypothetical protein
VRVVLDALACLSDEQAVGHLNVSAEPQNGPKSARSAQLMKIQPFANRTPRLLVWAYFIQFAWIQGYYWSTDELGNEAWSGRRHNIERGFLTLLLRWDGRHFFGGTVVARFASSSRTAFRSPGYQYSR